MIDFVLIGRAFWKGKKYFLQIEKIITSDKSKPINAEIIEVKNE